MDIKNSTKYTYTRLIIGIILLLLSIIPLYNSLMFFNFFWGQVISPFEILNFRQLSFITAPLFIMGYFLIFDKFAFRSIGSIISSSLGYSLILLGVVAIEGSYRMMGGGPGSLVAGGLFIIAIILIIIGVVIIAITSLKIRKHEKLLSQEQYKDSALHFMLKVLLLFFVIISPFLIFYAQQGLMNLSKVKTASKYIYSDPNQSSIRLQDMNYNLVYYNIETKEAKVDITEDELYTPGFNPIGYMHESITENENYKWDQTYIMDKSTGTKYKFPVHNTHNCQFFLNGKYAACFQYITYNSHFLYIMPIKNIIRK